MDDHEVRRFRTQMKLLQRRLRRESRPVYGVSRTASQVVAAVVRLGGAPGPRRIADELQMTSSNVAAALRELEEAGYVERRRDSADARRVSVGVTDRGRAVVAHVHSERDTWLGRAMEALLDEEERRVLSRAGELMERIAGFEHPAAPAAGAPGGAASTREAKDDAEGAGVS
ncbi:MarR family winged helix-turn-helix transcriptional regulator [Streptomyces fuscigenes]|uniref:MarR family winged helix-turn-helix transcriptional regulator n=1 Tax=Streptomyces fuscigenes TaxID=1528880 RepID=UPI001F429276|nr:MarR family winged helix-turn-helix transcriptional regulator [Streptomyces fuscigenes]MCF3965368.1 MarR family winged helix-turn-helix transcriptional regulator [Streptomyces fuscigenes]